MPTATSSPATTQLRPAGASCSARSSSPASRSTPRPPSRRTSRRASTDWTVALDLKGSGQSAWANYTSEHNVNGRLQHGARSHACGSDGTPCADYVAFTLDGQVISAPVNDRRINGGNDPDHRQLHSGSAQRPGEQAEVRRAAAELQPTQAAAVSATLGTAQLKAGLLAGGIGLILVVIYSLIYYRALGLVTIASLLVSGALTYGCLVMLGTQIGFTLSLAGIAGFIVAVGITADSFVVFFERLKDEVHEGRSVRVAVPRAWVRARRTILSADTVSFLAAAILYYFAAGDVRGFAFTLGLSTILDLVVVFLFTHPLVSLLSRSRRSARRGSPASTRCAPERAAGDPRTRPPRGRPAARPSPAAVRCRAGGARPSRAPRWPTIRSTTTPAQPAEIDADRQPTTRPTAPTEPPTRRSPTRRARADDAGGRLGGRAGRARRARLREQQSDDERGELMSGADPQPVPRRDATSTSSARASGGTSPRSS